MLASLKMRPWLLNLSWCKQRHNLGQRIKRNDTKKIINIGKNTMLWDAIIKCLFPMTLLSWFFILDVNHFQQK